MRCEFGYCMVCEKDIAQACGHCGAKKPTDQYTEVEVMWANGSKMKIAVCVTCASKNLHSTPEAKEGITKAHQDYWDKHNGVYDKEVTIV